MLTDAEKTRIRYHGGYPVTSVLSSMQAGTVVPLEFLQQIDSAMQRLTPEGENIVRSLLATIDQLEAVIRKAACQLKADRVGDIFLAGSLDPKARLATDRYEHEYRRWCERLVDALGVPLYAYSTRFNGGGPAGQGVNIRVRR